MQPTVHEGALARPSPAPPAAACGAALLVVLVLLLPACRPGAAGPPPAEGATGDAAGAADLPSPVAVDLARTGTMSTYYTATATLEVEKEAEVVARAVGIVDAIVAEEGDIVDEGAPLLSIGNAEYRLRLDQAVARSRDLRARLGRFDSMSRDLFSAEEYDTVKNELATAEAEEALARLNLSYTQVVAPFRGRVVRRLVDAGQNITVGKPLFLIADFEPLLARVRVPSREFKRLETEQEVELVLDSNGARLRGRITLVSPVIDPATGTIKVTVEIPEYPPQTRPGDFAEVRILTDSRAGATVVPRVAVFTDKADQVVYVAVAGLAERRVVEVGFADDERAEILSGVAPGEKVVIKGQRTLKHGAPLRVIDDPTSAARRETAGSFGS